MWCWIPILVRTGVRAWVGGCTSVKASECMRVGAYVRVCVCACVCHQPLYTSDPTDASHPNSTPPLITS
jgi:hypothetical protein